MTEHFDDPGIQDEPTEDRRPADEDQAFALAELREALTSLTLELEHLRHRVEVLEHNARMPE